VGAQTNSTAGECKRPCRVPQGKDMVAAPIKNGVLHNEGGATLGTNNNVVQQ